MMEEPTGDSPTMVAAPLVVNIKRLSGEDVQVELPIPDPKVADLKRGIKVRWETRMYILNCSTLVVVGHLVP